MSKFKIGDKVRRIPGEQDEDWPFGNRVIVISEVDENDNLHFDGETKSRDPEYFTLVEPASPPALVIKEGSMCRLRDGKVVGPMVLDKHTGCWKAPSQNFPWYPTGAWVCSDIHSHDIISVIETCLGWSSRTSPAMLWKGEGMSEKRYTFVIADEAHLAKTMGRTVADEMDALVNECIEKDKEIKRLREALKPFAEAAKAYDAIGLGPQAQPDDMRVAYCIDLGDLRRAKEELEK